MEGFHLEGPYISPEDGPRGAHPRQFVRPLNLDEFQRFQDAADGHILLLTLAPEWPGAPRFIEEVTRQGVVVSIGHTNAGAEDIHNAVSAGASLSTHLGNAALPFMPRYPNVIWEQLAEDRLMATFIVDGFHLPSSLLRAAWRAKESSRSILRHRCYTAGWPGARNLSAGRIGSGTPRRPQHPAGWGNPAGRLVAFPERGHLRTCCRRRG